MLNKTLAMKWFTFSLIAGTLLAQSSAPVSPPSIDTSVPVGDPLAVIHPRLIYKVEPKYTKAAFDHRVQGNVGLSLVIDADGVPRDISVAKSLDPGLDASAIEAVKRWRFEPGKEVGQAVSTAANIEVSFRLRFQPKSPESWFSPPPAAATHATPSLAALAHQKREVSFTALSNRIIPYHNHTDINLPGYARSNCYGSGSVWSYSVNCSSYVSPPTSIPIDINYIDVYQQASLDGLIYTMKCRAHWVGSACHGLIPNGVFRAKIDGIEMRVFIQVGGNMTKTLAAKYKIVDIR